MGSIWLRWLKDYNGEIELDKNVSLTYNKLWKRRNLDVAMCKEDDEWKFYFVWKISVK